MEKSRLGSFPEINGIKTAPTKNPNHSPGFHRDFLFNGFREQQGTIQFVLPGNLLWGIGIPKNVADWFVALTTRITLSFNCGLAI